MHQIVIGGVSKHLWEFFWLMCDVEIELTITMMIIAAIVMRILQWRKSADGMGTVVVFTGGIFMIKIQLFMIVIMNIIVSYRIYMAISSTELQVLNFPSTNFVTQIEF